MTTWGTHIRMRIPQLDGLGTLLNVLTYMTLDAQTRRNLELFQAGRADSREFSLLASLDMTRTPMGGRLLRRWLGQPLVELEPLERRLEAVGHFVGDGFRRDGALSLLSHIPDLERILSRTTAGVVAPRELLALESRAGGRA